MDELGEDVTERARGDARRARVEIALSGELALALFQEAERTGQTVSDICAMALQSRLGATLTALPIGLTRISTTGTPVWVTAGKEVS